MFKTYSGAFWNVAPKKVNFFRGPIWPHLMWIKDILGSTIGFSDHPPSEGSRSLNPARPLKQGSGYSDQVVAKASVNAKTKTFTIRMYANCF